MENTPLSPDAQAVLDAYFTHADLLDREVSHEEMLAAALRAAVYQAIPMTKTPWGSTIVPVLTAQESRERILAIATELESL
jgi:predicted deacylase